MSRPTRRRFLIAGTVGLAALSRPRFGSAASNELGIELSEEQLVRGRAFLLTFPSIDMHAHPGRFFLEDDVDPTPRMAQSGKPFTDKTIADLREGHVSAALFACPSDIRLLYAAQGGALLLAREFEPGEAWRDYRRQIGVLQRLVSQGKLSPGTQPSDVLAAQKSGDTACIMAVEGGDFIEDRLERVSMAYADGVRAITLVHYHNNHIGDIQTEPLTPGGLTATGRQIVKEMNRVGIIVDLSHASPMVVRNALDVASKPAMASHANLNRTDFEHPRLISAETAKLIAHGGGVVGSVPSGLGQKTFGDWINSILRLVDLVGADHVGIGTDMDANYAPVFSSYRGWYLIPAALLASGMNETEVTAVMGSNFQRLFAAVIP